MDDNVEVIKLKKGGKINRHKIKRLEKKLPKLNQKIDKLNEKLRRMQKDLHNAYSYDSMRKIKKEGRIY